MKIVQLTGGFVFLLSIALYVFTNQIAFTFLPFVLLGIFWLFLNFKSFYWFYLLSIPFSFTIYFLDDSLSTTLPDEPIMWIFLGISILILFYKPQIFPKWYFQHPIVLILFLQVIWLTFALFFSQDFILSLKYYLARLWFLNAFLIIPIFIFKKKEDFKTAFLLLVVPITVHAFFAFAWHSTLSFGYWDSNRVVAPFYQNHVDYSAVLSMVFPLLVIAFQLSKGKIKSRMFWGFTILFYIPALVAAASRAALLAVVFAFLIAFMVKIKKVRLVMPSIFIIIAFGITFMVHNNKYLSFRPSPSTATQETFGEAIMGIFTGKDMSSMERFYRWIAGVRMSRDHPLVGVGPNNFYENYKPYTVPTFATWVSRNEEQSTTHNYFLLMLVEQGWPAMILYALLLIAIFKRGEIIYHRTRDPFYKKTVMGLIMLLAAGFVNNFFSELLETHKIGALFYMSIALLMIIDHLTLKEENTLNSIS